MRRRGGGRNEGHEATTRTTTTTATTTGRDINSKSIAGPDAAAATLLFTLDNGHGGPYSSDFGNCGQRSKNKI